MPLSNEKIAESLADYHAKVERGALAKTFRIAWEIDLEGVDEAHAVLQALSYLRDAQSTATIFDVRSETNGPFVTIDLAESETDRSKTLSEAPEPNALAFVRQVAGFTKWGEPSPDDGSPFEPADMVDDSHSCLMDLIDEARALLKVPEPPNVSDLIAAHGAIARGDAEQAAHMLSRETNLAGDWQHTLDAILASLKEKTPSAMNDAELSLGELINEIFPGWDSVSGEDHYGSGQETQQ